MANKIKYGLKNVYYAVATIAQDGSATYAAPVRIPGAVNLSLDAQGESTPFYADNIVYYVSVANNGYQGDLEIALVPDAFKRDVLGYRAGGNKILVESANAPTVNFALLFEFAGDTKARRHVLYNCTAARPSVSGATKTESIEPQTESLTLTATTIYNAALQDDIVKGETDDTTADTVYNAWFEQVTVPTAPTP